MSWTLMMRDALQPPNSYAMRGENPVYAEKQRAYASAWQVSGFKPQEVKQEWRGNNPRGGFMGNEKLIRLDMDSSPMYPGRVGWHSDPVNAGPVYLSHNPEPTSPDILERDASRDARKWYPVPYDPYKNWQVQRGKLTVGINV